MASRCNKKKKYYQTFKSSYEKEFSCIISSRKSQNHAFCSLCNVDFTISHAGKGDIINHISSKKHKTNFELSSQCNKIKDYCENSNDLKIIRAECLFTSFLVEHNIPLSCADHIGPLLRKIFPDNEISKSYRCARTKTSAIVGEFANEYTSKLVAILRTQPFCIAIDASNENNSKLYPIIVTYFSKESQVVENNLLSNSLLNGDSTGLNIANLILENLKKFNIPLTNLIGMMSDNAPVMIGKKSGVISILKNHQNNIISIGCSCHLINLVAKKGAACLSFNIDELLVDIFYYFQKSSKKKEKLKDFQDLYNMETKRVIKHSPTRWLSMGRCINRLLELWKPLMGFFKEEVLKEKELCNLNSYSIPKKKSLQEETKAKKDEMPSLSKKREFIHQMTKDKLSKKKDFVNSDSSSISKNKNLIVQKEIKSKDSVTKRSAHKAGIKHTPFPKKCKISNNADMNLVITREERLFYILSGDINKAYCLFLVYIIPYFDRVNLLLQSSSPLIHKLKIFLLDFYKEMLSKFVKPSIINQELDCLKINYHDFNNQKSEKDILIGCETSMIVKNLKVEEKEKFFITIRNYYIKICDYMVHKFPFNNEILLHAEVCNVNQIQNASFLSVKYFAEMFPIFLIASQSNIDELEAEFCLLQVTKLSSDILTETKIDVQWTLIGQYKNELGQQIFNKLSCIMLYILSIPHSNTECERLFSQIKKIRNDFRFSLNDENLENLLIMKINLKSKCYDQEFSKKFLQKAKSCTYQRNKI